MAPGVFDPPVIRLGCTRDEHTSNDIVTLGEQAAFQNLVDAEDADLAAVIADACEAAGVVNPFLRSDYHIRRLCAAVLVLSHRAPTAHA